MKASRPRAPIVPAMELLVRYLCPEGWRAALLAALIAITIALQLLNPQIVRAFIDGAQAGDPLGALLWVAAAFLGSAALLQASRETSGRVVGFIGEVFGAVQAVKVAGAEQAALGYFRTLNEQRRATSLADRLFSELLGSVFWNSGNLATGVILLLVARQMRGPAAPFTVGDFALFTYYLSFIAEFTGYLGFLFAR